MDFVNVVRSLGVSKKHSQHNDDLFVDRLNHKYTVVILIIFSLVVTLSQYGGQPINCWVPGHFTGNYATYTDNICWVSSTYNIPLNEDLPNSETDRKTKLLKYYQWTPFILLFQALLFYLPRMIWYKLLLNITKCVKNEALENKINEKDVSSCLQETRSLNDKSGLDIQSIVDAVYNCYSDKSKFEDREKLLTYVTNSFDFYINSIKLPPNGVEKYYAHVNGMGDESGASSDSNSPRRRNLGFREMPNPGEEENSQDELEPEINDTKVVGGGPRRASTLLRRFYKVFCITKGKRYGNYLLALFVFVKIAYTVNSFAQLFILNHFLGNDFLLLGIEVMSKIWYGDDWTQLKRFPRVTMCDFRIREVGIVHRYTVQCVLSINLFNEKIFIFLWFWLCLVSIFNFLDLISWVYTLIINSQDTYSYIHKRLSTASIHFTDPNDEKLFRKFVKTYLREDVVLALRLLSRNSQDLIVSEIVANLYKLYKTKQIQASPPQRPQFPRHYQLAATQNTDQLSPKSKSILVDETNA